MRFKIGRQKTFYIGIVFFLPNWPGNSTIFKLFISEFMWLCEKIENYTYLFLVLCGHVEK